MLLHYRAYRGYHDADTEADYRDKSHTCAGAGSSLVSVVVGYKHHDAEILDYDTITDVPAHYEDVTEEYQYCTKCGKEK